MVETKGEKMTGQISIEPISLTTLALGAIFVLVFAVTCRAVNRMPLFGDRDGWITAACVAALSVIGLVRFFGSSGHVTSPAGESRKGGSLLDFVLLPYVALAISIVLVLLLLALGKWWSGKSAMPWSPRRIRPTSEARTLTRKRQPAAPAALRKKGEK
jgi:uncharacterized membrane protein